MSARGGTPSLLREFCNLAHIVVVNCKASFEAKHMADRVMTFVSMTGKSRFCKMSKNFPLC